MTRPTDECIQRAIILQLLRDDHNHTWPRAELERKLADLTPLAVNDALTTLANLQVIRIEGENVCATPCARHLDELELIGV
jgi:hypothetical protein